MLFSLTLSLDKNVIEIYNNANIKLFYQNLIDVALKHGWCISQAKKHYLVLKVAVMSPEGRLSFIAFWDSHLIIGIC